MDRVQAQNTLEVPIRERTGKFVYFAVTPPKLVRQAKHEMAEHSLDSKPSAPNSTPKASYYIDPQDELEVEQLKKQAPDLGSRATTLLSEAARLRERLVPELGVQLHAQFDSAIASLWRDVRTSLELREVLTRDVSLGGLSLAEEIADQVIKAAASERKSVEAKLASGALQVGGNEPSHQAVDILEFDRPAVTKHVVSSKIQSPVSKSAPKLRARPLSQARPLQVPLVTELKSRRGVIDQTESIHYPKAEIRVSLAKAVGPLEELETMNLEEFRRLAKKPEAASQKIYQKVDLLGDDSIDLKAKGIAAWHRSPLYQSYLEVGRTSMDSDKSVEAVIGENVAQGGLTLEEFQIIADLNRNLRF